MPTVEETKSSYLHHVETGNNNVTTQKSKKKYISSFNKLFENQAIQHKITSNLNSHENQIEELLESSKFCRIMLVSKNIKKNEI